MSCLPSHRTWLLMGCFITQLTGWRLFCFFQKRKKKCFINVLSSSFLQYKSAGGLCQVDGTLWAQSSHTLGEHFALSQMVCSHHSSLSLTAVPFRLVWLSQRLTQQLFSPYKARMSLHHEHFVQSWMFFHPRNFKKIQCKLE